MSVTGIFLLKTGKENAKQQLNLIGGRYFDRYGSNYRQNVAMLKTVCQNMITWIDGSLITEMAAATRYRKFFTALAARDLLTEEDKMWVYSILTEFMYLVENAIPFNELPSCRKFIGPSAEDAVSAINDHTQNKIAKAATCATLLVKKAENLTEISNIKDFYQVQLQTLQSDITQAGRPANGFESALLEAFNTEIGYCEMAMSKTAADTTKELTGLRG